MKPLMPFPTSKMIRAKARQLLSETPGIYALFLIPIAVSLLNVTIAIMNSRESYKYYESRTTICSVF